MKTLSTKILLIDDLRDLKADVICRNYSDGIWALINGTWDVLLLDHDLASFDGEDGREKTGYDVLCFLEMHPQYLPNRIELVTANPVGRQKMQALIERLYANE